MPLVYGRQRRQQGSSMPSPPRSPQAKSWLNCRASARLQLQRLDPFLLNLLKQGPLKIVKFLGQTSHSQIRPISSPRVSLWLSDSIVLAVTGFTIQYKTLVLFPYFQVLDFQSNLLLSVLSILLYTVLHKDVQKPLIIFACFGGQRLEPKLSLQLSSVVICQLMVSISIPLVYTQSLIITCSITYKNA